MFHDQTAQSTAPVEEEEVCAVVTKAALFLVPLIPRLDHPIVNRRVVSPHTYSLSNTEPGKTFWYNRHR